VELVSPLDAAVVRALPGVLESADVVGSAGVVDAGVVAEPDVDAEAGAAAPRLLTYETRSAMSGPFSVSAFMPPAFIAALGAESRAVSLAGGNFAEMLVSAGPTPPPTPPTP
jgi:hypothetical protein